MAENSSYIAYTTPIEMVENIGTFMGARDCVSLFRSNKQLYKLFSKKYRLGVMETVIVTRCKSEIASQFDITDITDHVMMDDDDLCPEIWWGYYFLSHHINYPNISTCDLCDQLVVYSTDEGDSEETEYYQMAVGSETEWGYHKICLYLYIKQYRIDNNMGSDAVSRIVSPRYPKDYLPETWVQRFGNIENFTNNVTSTTGDNPEIRSLNEGVRYL